MRDKIILIGSAVAAIVVGVLIFAYTTRTASKSPSLETSTIGEISTTTVPFIKLAQGKQSAITKRVNYYLTSSEQLNELWRTIGAAGTPPTVDFTSEMVLAVFAGREPSVAIAIEKVEDALERVVSIVVEKPDNECAEKKPVLSPYELIIVPATSLPLTHEDIIATTSCSN